MENQSKIISPINVGNQQGQTATLESIKKRNHTGFAFTDREILILNRALNKKDIIQYIKKDGNDSIILKKKDKNNNTVIELPAISNIESSPIGNRIEDALKDFNDLKTTNNLTYPIRLLAPYKLSDSWHWNVLEIIIPEKEDITCKRYNTDGKIYEVENDIFNNIENTFNNRNIINHKQTKKFGVNLQKGVNCGLACALIMHDLKNIKDSQYINNSAMENKSDQELRNEISELVFKNIANNDNDRATFCKPIDESNFVIRLGEIIEDKETQEIFKLLQNLNITKDQLQNFNQLNQEDTGSVLGFIKKYENLKGICCRNDGGLKDGAVDAVCLLFNTKNISNKFNESQENLDFGTILEFYKSETINEEEFKSYLTALSFDANSINDILDNLKILQKPTAEPKIKYKIPDPINKNEPNKKSVQQPILQKYYNYKNYREDTTNKNLKDIETSFLTYLKQDQQNFLEKESLANTNTRQFLKLGWYQKEDYPFVVKYGKDAEESVKKAIDGFFATENQDIFNTAKEYIKNDKNEDNNNKRAALLLLIAAGDITIKNDNKQKLIDYIKNPSAVKYTGKQNKNNSNKFYNKINTYLAKDLGFKPEFTTNGDINFIWDSNDTAIENRNKYKESLMNKEIESVLSKEGKKEGRGNFAT